MKRRKGFVICAVFLSLTMLMTSCASSQDETTAQADTTTAAESNETTAAESDGTTAAADDTTAADVATDETFKIGISQPFMGHPVRIAGQVLIDEWAAAHPNVEIVVTDGELNANKQIADIEDLLASQCDAILVCAHQSPTLVNVLQEVKDAGIPLVAFDRPFTDKAVQIAEVYNDDITAGQYGAELLIEGMGESGEIAILQGPAGNTTSTMRQDGFMSVIENYPDINIVSDQVADFQRVNAVDIFENVIQANPDIKGVYCHNDEMALGVCKVLSDMGRDDVIVVGVDGQKDALESIIAGELYGTVRKNLEFPMALDMAYEFLTTGACEDSILLEGHKINADNVNDYYDPEAIF